ncbi:MAG TPA: hypothetical protein VF491_14630 [Vicinamibacterales bacterium]
MTAVRLTMLMAALAAASCGDSAETPTSPTTTAPTTILFSGTLQPRGTRFYSYSMSSGGSVSAMLASLERNNTPMPNTIELGLGTPAGTGCAVVTSSQTSASLVPQLQQDASIGTYCVRISDTEGLPVAMNFTIRVIHP